MGQQLFFIFPFILYILFHCVNFSPDTKGETAMPSPLYVSHIQCFLKKAAATTPGPV